VINAPKYKIPRDRQEIHVIDDSVKTVEWEQSGTNEERILWTKAQVAEYLTVSVSTISAWITQKRLRVTKVGSCTRITKAEVFRFVEECNKRPHVEPVTRAS